MGGEETRPGDEEGSDPEPTLGQALSSFWRETSKAIREAVEDAADEVREKRAAEQAKKMTDSIPDDNVRYQKGQLFDLLRSWQPNIDGDDVAVLCDALWAYYEHWVIHGPGSIWADDKQLVENQPLMFANEIADIIVARCKRQGVEFEQVPHILLNASSHAGQVYDYLKEIRQHVPKKRKEQRQYATAVRITATLRDSLEQASRLMQGEELEEPDERIIHRTEKTPSGSITQDPIRVDDLPDDDDDSVVVIHAEGDADTALRMGYAYKVVKDVDSRIATIRRAGYKATDNDLDTWSAKIKQAMAVLKGDEPVPTNGGE